MENINTIVDVLTAQIALLLVLAGTVERISEYIKIALVSSLKKDIPVVAKQGLTLAVSILFCLITETSFDVGMTIPAVAQQIIAGILVSFGSDALHSLLTFVKSVKNTQEAKTADILSNITPCLPAPTGEPDPNDEV